MSHIEKILVPMDGSPSSIAALEEAVVLAEELAATIDVLHVYAPDRFELGSSTAATDASVAEAEREMESAIGEARALVGDRLSRRTESGEPVRKILEIAAADARRPHRDRHPRPRGAPPRARRKRGGRRRPQRGMPGAHGATRGRRGGVLLGADSRQEGHRRADALDPTLKPSR